MKLVKNVVPEALSKAVQYTVIKFHMHERIDFKIVKFVVRLELRTMLRMNELFLVSKLGIL